MPIKSISILTAFTTTFHPSDPFTDTCARSPTVCPPSQFPLFAMFLAYRHQFLTTPSRPYTRFEALIYRFLSSYSPSLSVQPLPHFLPFTVTVYCHRHCLLFVIAFCLPDPHSLKRFTCPPTVRENRCLGAPRLVFLLKVQFWFACVYD